jgi:DNA-binding NtrC family response regulator
LVIPRKLLVIDDNSEGGFLLVRSLARRFPGALIQLCKDSRTALESLAKGGTSAVILHKTHGHDAVSLIRSVRNMWPGLLIVAVSGADRSEQVLEAGATAFLNYDQWPTLGHVVAIALVDSQAAIISA